MLPRLLGRLRRPSTARSAGILGLSNLGRVLLRLVGSLLVARLLLPAEMGVFNAVGVVLTYVPFLHLGLINGLQRELPLLIGQGRRARGCELASTAQFWALACGVLCGVAAAGWGVSELVRGNWQWGLAWVARAVALLCLIPMLYFTATFRTGQEFIRLGLANFVGAMFGGLMVLAVWGLGFEGQCIRLAATSLLTCGILWWWHPIRVRPRFRWADFLELLKVGAPLFVASYLRRASMGLDRLMLARGVAAGTVAKAELGAYTLAILTVTAGGQVIVALGQVAYPRMLKDYGRTGNARAALKWVVRPTLLLAGASLPIFVGLWFALPPLVRLALPRYVAGVEAAQWSLVSLWLLCFNAPLSLYNVLKKYLIYGAINLMAVPIYLGVLWLLRAYHSKPLVPYAQALALTLLFVQVVGLVLLIPITRRHQNDTMPPPPPDEASINGPEGNA